MTIFTAIARAALAAALLATSVAALSEERDENTQSALMRELRSVALPLESGIAAGAREGMPVSAKYEIEDEGFQLSVITWKEGKFTEVIVDHRTGGVAKASQITDNEELAEVGRHREAMEGAKRSLHAATAAAVKEHRGYRAVSAVPAIKDGRPVLTILLLRGDKWQTVSKALD